jgi:hypothetical protein
MREGSRATSKLARSLYDHVIRAQCMQMNAHPDVTQREGKMWLPSPSSIVDRTCLK